MDVLSVGFLALPTLTFLFDNFPLSFFFQDFFFSQPSARLEQLLVFFIVSFINSPTPEQYHKVALYSHVMNQSTFSVIL